MFHDPIAHMFFTEGKASEYASRNAELFGSYYDLGPTLPTGCLHAYSYDFDSFCFWNFRRRYLAVEIAFSFCFIYLPVLLCQAAERRRTEDEKEEFKNMARHVLKL